MSFTPHRLLRSALLAAILVFPPSAGAQPLVFVTEGPYIMATGSGEVYLNVINTATGNRVARLFLGMGVGDQTPAVVASADGRTAYAAVDSSLLVIDVATMTIAHTLPLGQGVIPSRLGPLALSPDGSRLYVASLGALRLLALDTANITAVPQESALPHTATEFAVSPDGARLYALQPDGDRISAINLTAGTVAGTIDTAPSPRHMAFGPDGSRLYVAHSTGATETGDGDSVASYDTAALSLVSTLPLPDARAFAFVYFPSAVGRMAMRSSGDRLYVPRVTQGWRTSPTRYFRHERVEIVQIAGDTLSLLQTVSMPTPASFPGTIGAATSAPSSDVFVAGAGSTAAIDPATNAVREAGPAVPTAAAMAAAPAPPCWFEVSPQQRYPRGGGGQIMVPIPAPAGCNWTTTSDAAWIGVLTPSGTGPGHVTLQISSSTEPRTGTVRIGGQTILVSQIIASVVIDTPRPGSDVTLPFDLGGWAADRRAAGPIPDAVTNPGIDLVELWVQRDGGTPTLVRSLPYGLLRPDVGALYGGVYTNSGFAARIGRLGAGPQTLIVRARSRYDGMLHEASVAITVRRQPLVAIDSPGAGAVLTQPFDVSGWAADMTAPTGMGVDVVHVWAYPVTGGLPIFAGAATYGQDRGDLQAFFGFGPIPAGYRLNVSGLPAGTYTLVAFARSTETSAFDATASVVVTVTAPPPGAPFGVVDTPASGAEVAGAIGVTGWALDETAVTRVAISRDPIGSETGEIYIGDATFVAGVRPDVMVAYPGYPDNASGWGLMVLTNMLPGGGNGPVTFHADAHDGAGNVTRIGSRTVTAANAGSLQPFGTLDTPAQGATVSGTIPVFGWALSPTSLIPLDGSTIDVLIDGVVVGHPTFNLCRGTVGTSPPAGTCNDDIATTFGAAYPNIAQGSGAIGVYLLDTATLSPGIHRIAWRVTDGNGQTAGIGSRFIWVNNP